MFSLKDTIKFVMSLNILPLSEIFHHLKSIEIQVKQEKGLNMCLIPETCKEFSLSLVHIGHVNDLDVDGTLRSYSKK